MTTPIVSPASIFAPPPPPQPGIDFPLGWLLENASPAIQYRAIIDVAQLGQDIRADINDLPYSYRPALELAVQADIDGVWNNSMLRLPSQRSEHFEGVGTVPAFRRLTEYGWNKEAPPLFQSEHYQTMELLYEYLTRPLPRQDPVQQVGTQLCPVPHVVLGDLLPHRNAVEGDIPAALGWLELMARLGFLRRNDNWTKMYERFIEDSDRTGVWHPRKGMAMPKSTNPYVWPMFPLEAVHGGDERWTDVTFRVGLIARLSGRPVELI